MEVGFSVFTYIRGDYSPCIADSSMFSAPGVGRVEIAGELADAQVGDRRASDTSITAHPGLD